MSPVPGSAIDPNVPIEDTASPWEVDYMQPKVQEDADLQIKWSNWMSDDKSPWFYKRVFVLLLSWHPECDDMAVDAEVVQLL